MSDNSQFGIGIRDIASIEEMGAVERLQREVWGCADVDVVPRMMLRPATEVGGVLVGAYDGARLVGFAFGFVGLEGGRLVLHSHMLAVTPEYRARGLGFRLKLAQRARALAGGIELMTWTFDPLQSRNARLNFARLGAVSDSYRVDYYGDVSTSALHRGTGTDRLWVTWHLTDERVGRRLAGENVDGETKEYREARAVLERDELDRAVPLVQSDEDGSPVTAQIAQGVRGELVSIDIPEDINALVGHDAALALKWREATRAAFGEAFAAGFIAEDFFRVERRGQPCGAYLLRRRGEGGG